MKQTNHPRNINLQYKEIGPCTSLAITWYSVSELKEKSCDSLLHIHWDLIIVCSKNMFLQKSIPIQLCVVYEFLMVSYCAIFHAKLEWSDVRQILQIFNGRSNRSVITWIVCHYKIFIWIWLLDFQLSSEMTKQINSHTGRVVCKIIIDWISLEFSTQYHR